LGYHRVRAGPFHSFVVVWVAAFGLVATLVGCGAGNVQVTATGGVGGRVGDIVIRNAQFIFAGPVAKDTVYEPGDNASLKLSIVNEGDRIDRLVRVTSPIARSATITGDATIPGHQVLTAGYQGPIASTALPGTHTVRIMLTGLRVPIRAGLTYPVAFTFEQAGELRLELPVENPNIARSGARQLSP
jgi:periplasmic copper chaperone A